MESTESSMVNVLQELKARPTYKPSGKFNALMLPILFGMTCVGALVMALIGLIVSDFISLVIASAVIFSIPVVCGVWLTIHFGRCRNVMIGGLIGLIALGGYYVGQWGMLYGIFLMAPPEGVGAQTQISGGGELVFDDEALSELGITEEDSLTTMTLIAEDGEETEATYVETGMIKWGEDPSDFLREKVGIGGFVGFIIYNCKMTTLGRPGQSVERDPTLFDGIVAGIFNLIELLIFVIGGPALGAIWSKRVFYEDSKKWATKVSAQFPIGDLERILRSAHTRSWEVLPTLPRLESVGKDEPHAVIEVEYLKTGYAPSYLTIETKDAKDDLMAKQLSLAPVEQVEISPESTAHLLSTFPETGFTPPPDAPVLPIPESPAPESPSAEPPPEPPTEPQA